MPNPVQHISKDSITLIQSKIDDTIDNGIPFATLSLNTLTVMLMTSTGKSKLLLKHCKFLVHDGRLKFYLRSTSQGQEDSMK